MAIRCEPYPAAIRAAVVLSLKHSLTNGPDIHSFTVTTENSTYAAHINLFSTSNFTEADLVLFLLLHWRQY